MTGRLLDILLTLGAFIAVYALPAFPVARRWNAGSNAFETVLIALALGLSSQCVIGMLWSHLFGKAPWAEGMVYLCFWLAAGLIAGLYYGKDGLHIRQRKNTASPLGGGPLRGEAFVLFMVLLAGITLREVHPFRHAALGQSDAYSHLQFLREIVENGRLGTVIYPPGYHWTLALPVMAFQLDPYLVARYGGAFFGGILILAVYCLAAWNNRRTAAIAAAFFVACFPGLMLLIKTGVGAFANQLGICLVPIILLRYMRVVGGKEENEITSLVLLGACLLGLAASVPLMLISVVILAGIERLMWIVLQKGKWKREAWKPVMAFLPAVILICFHFIRAGSAQHEAALVYVVGEDDSPKAAAAVESNEPAQSPRNHYVFKMAQDFFAVKRIGLNNFVLDAACVALFFAFGIVFLAGMKKRRTSHEILGLWGLLCLAQTATGFLEFTHYQRAGWLLLTAIGWLGGISYQAFREAAGQGKALLCAEILGASAIVVWAFMKPPAHLGVTSSAEDDIVGLTRQVFVTRTREKRLFFDKPKPSAVVKALNADLSVVIVSRSFSGFQHNAGDMLDAILGSGTGIETISVGMDTDLRSKVRPDRQYILLMDKDVKLSRAQLGMLSYIEPKRVSDFARWRHDLYAPNANIRSFVAGLDSNLWLVETYRLGENLELSLAQPRKGILKSWENGHAG